MPSVEQIAGFHVVCAECSGFVVRDGVVRNCAHKRDSAAGLSERSARAVAVVVGKGGKRKGSRSSTLASVENQVRISVQPPTPTGSESPGLDSRRRSRGSLGGVCLADTTATGAPRRRSVKVQRRESVPAILRPGYVIDDRGVWRLAHEGRVMNSKAYPSRIPRPSAAVERDAGVDLSIRAGDAVQGSRLHRPNAIRRKPSPDDDDGSSFGRARRDSEALMQDWGEWSERWRNLVTGEKNDVDDSGSTDRVLCDADFLMQEWREWSERWERSLRRR